MNSTAIKFNDSFKKNLNYLSMHDNDNDDDIHFTWTNFSWQCTNNNRETPSLQLRFSLEMTQKENNNCDVIGDG